MTIPGNGKDEPASPRTPRFFVLAGNQRSGSHALALALERRGAIAVPTEPRFATSFARHPGLAGNLDRPGNRRRLLRCIFAFLWLWERRYRSRAQLLDTIPHSLLGLADQAEEIALQCGSYGEIVNALHERFARRHGARVDLDKVTFLHEEPVLPLARHVPGLKVVHVVRDGRDVRLSWLRVWFGVRNGEEAALRWRRRVLGLRRLGERLPGDYLEVRYEDFIARPDATCERILEFVGLDAREETAAAPGESPVIADKSALLAEREGHEKLADSLDTSRRWRWREQMPAGERRCFEELAGDALADLGYEVGAGRPPARRWRRLSARLRATAAGCIRPVLWKQYMVHWLPAILLLSDRLGLPLARRLHASAVEAIRSEVRADASHPTVDAGHE